MQTFAKVTTTVLLSIAYASAQDVRSVAHKVAARYKSLNGFQAQGTYEVSGGHNSEVGSLAWTVSKFQIETSDRGAKQRIDYKGTNFALSVISNGSSIWTYAPDQKSYTQVDAVSQTGEGDETESGIEPQDENAAISVYGLAITRFATFDRFAGQSKITGEQEIKTSEGKVRCWILETRFTDRTEKDWVAQSSFLVLRSEAQIKTQDLTAKLTISMKRFELEPPSSDRFAFVPGKKDKQVDELTLPGVTPTFVGKASKDFALKTADGEPIRLSDYRGKVVVLDFWATWCPPCRQELPVINKLAAELKAQNVLFIGINDEGAGTVKSFNAKNRYTFTTLQDPGRKVANAYGARSIPNVFVIGKDGVVVKHFVGSRDESALMAGIQLAQAH